MPSSPTPPANHPLPPRRSRDGSGRGTRPIVRTGNAGASPPRRRGGPLRSLFVMAIAIAAMALLVLTSEGQGPLGALATYSSPGSGQAIDFVVQPGDTVAAVTNRLTSGGFLTGGPVGQWSFSLLARFQHLGASLKSGTYQLRHEMGAAALISVLQQPPQPIAAPTVRVTIPEGWRLEQVAERLQRADVVSVAEFERVARLTPTQDRAAGLFGAFPDVAARPASASLEGYLFPNTYQLPLRTTPQQVITIMLRDFEKQITPAMRHQLAINNLSVYQALTVASLVEREAATPADRPLIAGVYYNRLAGHEGGFLNADPAIQYALGYNQQQKTWWPHLTGADLDVASPYNTYGSPHPGHAGWLPGPIASPGLASLQAAIWPTMTTYEYFFAGPDGKSHFCVTLACQNATIAQFGGGNQ